jgi:Na+/H+ antiporter NhaD/arsenite permease-like protein
MITTIIVLSFLIGYLAITAEHSIGINKAATALLTGVVCWTLYALTQQDVHLVSHQLAEHVGEISGILFFLMGAMTIVELIDTHDGFEIITSRITTRNKRKLLWLLSSITFLLSAILDNLTTTIVMVSLVRKLFPAGNTRLLFASVVVIAANAGGAWSPIGDVTTTMLWIGGQITSMATITHLILPSIVCTVVPLGLISFRLKGTVEEMVIVKEDHLRSSPRERNLVFGIGLVSLIFVPVFKSITHLPPYMGILGALGVMWIITEIMHSKKDDQDKDRFSVLYALQKIDMPSILFFLGILLAIGALQFTGALTATAQWLDLHVGNISVVVIIIGFLSAIVDNVPLVAAAMSMYDLNQYPVDHYFWQFLAYSAGTGGSMLIIGSAAGVAAMGIEKINFFWYLRNMSWLALIGFAAGAGVFMLQSIWLSP